MERENICISVSLSRIHEYGEREREYIDGYLLVYARTFSVSQPN